MKIEFLILIYSIPFLFEWIRESYWFIKANKEDDHKSTTLLRFVMILCVTFFMMHQYSSIYVGIIGGISMCIAMHYLCFNYFINFTRRYLGRHTHLGNDLITVMIYINGGKIDQRLDTAHNVIGGSFLTLITFWKYQPDVRISIFVGGLMLRAFVFFSALGYIQFYK